ncbi:MAG: aspartyl protease family protein [Pseudomonadota bacterium]
MFRTSLLLIFGITVGAVLGWWTRGELETAGRPQAAVAKAAVNPETTKGPDNVAVSPQIIEEISESPVFAIESVPIDEFPGVDSKRSVAIELTAANIDDFMTLCSGQSDSTMDHCRQQIMESNRREDLDMGQAIYLHQQWLAENPSDIGIGIQYAQLLIDGGRYTEALDYLDQLQSQTSGESDLVRVQQWQFRLGQQALKQLSLEDDKLLMLPLLDRLIVMVPDHAPWRFALAQLQYDAGKLSESLDSLGYLLYDNVFGERAQALYDSIIDRMSLSNYTEVPLLRKGNHFVVKALVGGREQMNLLIDTGASLTTIDKRSLKRSGLLQGGQPITLNTAGGRVASTLQPLSSLSLANQTLYNLKIATLDHSQNQVDGLLGMDYLGQFDFVLDQDQAILFLTPKQ